MKVSMQGFLLTVLALTLAACQTGTTSPLSPATNTINLPPTPGKGQVQATIVQGEVSLLASTGKSVPLRRGDTFEHGSMVICGPDGNCLLVFSNGAIIKMTPNGKLTVRQFDQAPFNPADTGAFMRLTKDPSKSHVQLDLLNGTLAAEVKPLDTDAGSRFTIETPASIVSIHDAIFCVTITRNAAGQVTGQTSSCVEGSMTLDPNPSIADRAPSPPFTPVEIRAGGQLQISLTIAPGTNNVTGISVAGAGLSTTTSRQLLADIITTINIARPTGGLDPLPPPIPTPTPPVGVQLAPPAPPLLSPSPPPPNGPLPPPPPPPDIPQQPLGFDTHRR